MSDDNEAFQTFDLDKADAIIAAAIKNAQRWRRFAKSHPEIYAKGAISLAVGITQVFGDPNVVLRAPSVERKRIARLAAVDKVLLEIEDKDERDRQMALLGYERVTPEDIGVVLYDHMKSHIPEGKAPGDLFAGPKGEVCIAIKAEDDEARH